MFYQYVLRYAGKQPDRSEAQLTAEEWGISQRVPSTNTDVRVCQFRV